MSEVSRFVLLHRMHSSVLSWDAATPLTCPIVTCCTRT